jgi:hypothetical protein
MIFYAAARIGLLVETNSHLFFALPPRGVRVDLADLYASHPRDATRQCPLGGPRHPRIFGTLPPLPHMGAAGMAVSPIASLVNHGPGPEKTTPPWMRANVLASSRLSV